jgi:hypothetical protein
MARLINTREAEISILAHFAVLDAVYKERRVACGAESFGVAEISGQRDCFAAEPGEC